MYNEFIANIKGDTHDFHCITEAMYVNIRDSAIKIFNHYNGIINRIIPAELTIEMTTPLPKAKLMGSRYYPNRVYLYLSNILKAADGNIHAVITLIVNTIIHELYHIDQSVICQRCINDKQYVTQIETEVEFMVYSYIMNNKESVTKVAKDAFSWALGTNDNFMITYIGANEVTTAADIFNNGVYLYNRVNNIYDHILIGIKNILFNHPKCDDIMQQIYNILANGIPFAIVINDDPLVITDYDDEGDLCIVDMNDINMYMYNTYFKYDMVYYALDDIYIDDFGHYKALYVKDIDANNLMCSLVNKK